MELVLITVQVVLGIVLLGLGYEKLEWQKTSRNASLALNAMFKKMQKLCGFVVLGLALINIIQYLSDRGVV